jgi:hypothetical protein
MCPKCSQLTSPVPDLHPCFRPQLLPNIPRYKRRRPSRHRHSDAPPVTLYHRPNPRNELRCEVDAIRTVAGRSADADSYYRSRKRAEGVVPARGLYSHDFCVDSGQGAYCQDLHNTYKVRQAVFLSGVLLQLLFPFFPLHPSRPSNQSSRSNSSRPRTAPQEPQHKYLTQTQQACSSPKPPAAAINYAFL